MQGHPSDTDIQRFVDDEPEAASLRAHVDGCAACARLAADYRKLGSGGRRIRSFEPAADFASHMVDRLIEERRATWAAIEVAGLALGTLAWLAALVWLSTTPAVRAFLDHTAAVARALIGLEPDQKSAPLVVTLLICLTLFGLLDRLVLRHPRPQH
jgi:hypothetical protein